jgi:DNA-directed RNA polymerase I subunit RPA49
MDYTVKADGARGVKPALNHFLGIYDPKTGKLEVVEAKKMTMRASVRSKQSAAAAAAERDANQVCSWRNILCRLILLTNHRL